ncbi:pyridoxine 5'-phosphate synthase [Altererythrobacter sp. Root672]|uniref:pyridoxine 5'-phosphate synthase n=1 Tax=Altererythrobacter sp. Root672 TaxID=1736584 RepID=UPI0006F82782|nr:pyridoxine 5'-phosphate synthase [Altererythrobacter sp. Root672]KRA82798.1 pyridoxine 5'-phosphate synthase [Altererythrobacter sp. Root672]
MSGGRLRLGVNIDHVATIRNARGGEHPDPVRAAEIVASVGGDGITAHLREDRRHIRDEDLRRIQDATDLPLNLEMAATDEMVEIALRHMPHAACIVPEKREERTTEGGLDAAGQHNHLQPVVSRLVDAGIRVSLFIAPDERQLDAALRLGAPVVEFHTGEYAHATGDQVAVELKKIADMAALAAKNGIEPHAGHGLTYENVQPIAAIPQLAELNIGHYLIGEAVFVGLENAVRRMREMMDAAR